MGQSWWELRRKGWIEGEGGGRRRREEGGERDKGRRGGMLVNGGRWYKRERERETEGDTYTMYMYMEKHARTVHVAYKTWEKNCTAVQWHIGK